MMLSSAEYRLILRRDFMSFIERSFYELNPQTRFIPGLHIEMMAAKLEACRQGKIKRLIINLPPRNQPSRAADRAQGSRRSSAPKNGQMAWCVIEGDVCDWQPSCEIGRRATILLMPWPGRTQAESE